MKIDLILSRYPKRRKNLPASFQRIYKKEYLENRNAITFLSKIVQYLESWMHKSIAKNKNNYSPVLEIGAGTLNHLKYEKETCYDIIEPTSFFLENNSKIKEIRSRFDSIFDINEENIYSRIFSIAVLEHIEDLPKEVAKSSLLLKTNGIFQAGIPTEGGFLWELSWRLTTGISFWIRNKMNYGILMQHEHINNQDEILEIIKYFFSKVKVKRFPFNIKHLSFYTYIEALNPKKSIAQNYLKNKKV